MGTREIDHEYTIFPTCPYCGYEDEDWWEGAGAKAQDGDSWEEECGACGRAYTARKLDTEKIGGSER
jgi:hypothetical protein